MNLFQIFMDSKLKYLLILILFLLQATPTAAIARAPKPYCTSKPLVKQFPFTVDELLTYDMSKTFTGYNLAITLGSNNSWATVTPKWQQLDRVSAYFPNIISHYVEAKDNTVGRESFLLYKDTSGAIKLSYGLIRDQQKLPIVNSTATVTTDKNVVCFDAALFLQHGLAIVDCAKTGGSIFTTYKNMFYIIDLTSHTIKKIVENDMYIGFTKVTRRKLLKFSHPSAGGLTYMLRSYFSDAVDERNSDNTYLEIFSVPVEDPTTIEPLRIIDRTFLNVKSLRIMDVELYLDDIFLLDYDSGLFRLDILQSQRIQMTGIYRDFGFTKVAVYSDDLEDKVIIALSNKQSVFQIDWHNPIQPVLLNKYALMENSTVKQIFLNDLYLIVQSSADAYNSTNPKFEVDYTWIFTRGTKSYLNAYHIINHNSSQVDIEFDREKSRLYIADERGLTLRQISQAQLVMKSFDSSRVGKQEDVVIYADSFDPNSNETFRCQQKLTAIFVNKDNYTIFPTGIDPVPVYSVNYPNPLQIPLNSYFMGPDINYQLQTPSGDVLPTSWINKINTTTVQITPAPRFGDILFFHTDVVPHLGYEHVLFYYQDSQFTTHVAECQHQWSKNSMKCIAAKSYNHTSKLRSFASTYFKDDNGDNYYFNLVMEGENKVLHINDFARQQVIAIVTFEGDYEAEITSIAASNGYLYVLHQYGKTIDVFSLPKCEQYGKCSPEFSIDAFTMKGLGVTYFSPVAITTDKQHPEVLFISCRGSLIIVDVDNKQKLHLLDQIVSPVTAISNFQVAVNRNRMVLVAPPNLIYEYSLEHIYIYRMVTFVKVISTYGLIIQPEADVQFSDYDNMVYVNAVDQAKNKSVVLVYRTGHAAAISLYTKIELDKLYSRPGFEVEVSGFFVDFLTIISGNNFQCFRVFSEPFLTINEADKDFTFKIQAYNPISTLSTSNVGVAVINQKQIITPTKFFNETNSQLSAGKVGTYQWEDRQWFDGNIIHYNYSCDDCNKGADSKIKIREHIDSLEDLPVEGNYYTESLLGGFSVSGDLFRYRPNGSIWSVENLPDQRYLERCLKVASAENEIFAITACQESGKGTNIYITSFTSYKSFTWGPFKSSAVNVRTLQIINDVAMLADTPLNPEFLTNKGAVYLYRVSFNPESEDQMDELEVFDESDLIGVAGWTEQQAWFGNAHMVYSANTDAFRLYITEVRFGFFVIDFLRHPSESSITILSINFVNVRKLIQDFQLHMPTQAIFQAIHFIKSVAHPHFDVENVIITTKGYDNIEVSLYFDDTGHIQVPLLYRIYKRYSFYNALNEVHARDGYVVIGYVLPYNVDQQAHRKQYISIYDSISYPFEFDKGYSERYMIASVPLNTTSSSVFSLNTTYDFHTNGTRSGIVITLPGSGRMMRASISHNLTLSLLPGYKTQPVTLQAYNDFSTYEFTAQVVYTPDDDDGKSKDAMLIIIIVLCSIVFVFFVFYICAVIRRKKPTEQRESLMTDNDTVARESVRQAEEPAREEYRPPNELVRQEPEASEERIEDQSVSKEAVATIHSQSKTEKKPEIISDIEG